MVQATEMRETRQEQVRDGSRDFDFLNGRHRVHNVRFAGRLEQSERWETFEALSISTPLPQGTGCIDELVADGRGGCIGTTLRLYDRRIRRWSLYRMDSASGLLQPPLQGAFRDGTGVFEGRDELGGQPVRVRLTWSHISPTSARCEQAYSRDSGTSWESCWIMQYMRLEDRRPQAPREQGMVLATEFMFSDPPANQGKRP